MAQPIRPSLHLACALAVMAGCSGSSEEGTTVDPGTTDATSDATSDETANGDDSGSADDSGSTGNDAPVTDSATSTTDTRTPTDTKTPPADGQSDTVSAGSDGATMETPAGGATVPNLKVAFVGDMGNRPDSTLKVLQLIKSEGAAFVVILGDFDYISSPTAWETMLNTGLGADFPVFAAEGNHDVASWSGYKSRFEARLGKITGASCTGEYGQKMSCTYQGLFFILSSIGTEPVVANDAAHTKYLRDSLAADKSIWRVCAWHKNQNAMQIGGKGNEVGWDAYQICQNAGALVMTGHEHSYSRTKTMNDVGDGANGHGAAGEFARMVVKAGAPGSNFVTVSGLGGVERRDHEPAHDSDTWWATWYASNGHYKNGVTTPLGGSSSYGATFVTFNVGGDPKKAKGYFKTITGVEVDAYEITKE